MKFPILSAVALKRLAVAAVAASVISFSFLTYAEEKEVLKQEKAEAAVSMPAPAATHEHHAKASGKNNPLPLTLDVDLSQKLKKGETAEVRLTLKDRDGKGVGPDALEEVHTKKVHALLIDESLSDYVHAHPEPGKEAGQWVFSFTPKTAHGYKLWLDLKQANQEGGKVAASLVGAEPCKAPCVDQTLSNKAKVGDVSARLFIDKPRLRAGASYKAMLYLSGADGEPLANIEPIMGAYSHIVGFAPGLKGVTHMHPMGLDPKSGRDRTSSPVTFLVEPQEEGFMKLFVQVKAGGKEYVFPFGLEARAKEGAAKKKHH